MESFKGLTDELLVKEIKENPDAKLFAVLIDRYEKKVQRKCLQLVRDDDTAKDLTQEIFIKIYLNLKNYQQEAKFSTWLYAIVHNTSMDYLRKNKKRLHLSITEELLEVVENIAEEEEEISREVDTKILDELFEKIPPEDKVLLLLKYKDDHKIKDIQNMLHLSESAVKMRLKRAKERIQSLYKNYS